MLAVCNVTVFLYVLFSCLNTLRVVSMRNSGDDSAVTKKQNTERITMFCFVSESPNQISPTIEFAGVHKDERVPLNREAEDEYEKEMLFCEKHQYYSYKKQESSGHYNITTDMQTGVLYTL